MEERKPLLITLSALAGLVLLTAAAALLVRSYGGTRYRSGADAPYPYAWTERRNGTISLRLDGSGVEDGVWISSDGSGVVNTFIGEEKRGVTAVTLRPVSEGRAVLTFRLDSGEERIAEVVFTVETQRTGNRLAVTVNEHGEYLRQGITGGGEETGYPFTARTDEGGVLTIRIAARDTLTAAAAPPDSSGDGTDVPESGAEPLTETAEEVEEAPQTDEAADSEEDEENQPVFWEISSSNELAAAAVIRTNTGRVLEAALSARIPGTVEVTVSSEAADLSYVFSVRSENGFLLLTGSRSGAYVPTVPADAELEASLARLTETVTAMEAVQPAPDETPSETDSEAETAEPQNEAGE